MMNHINSYSQVSLGKTELHFPQLQPKRFIMPGILYFIRFCDVRGLLLDKLFRMHYDAN